MNDNWRDSNSKKISISEDWFEVYEITTNLFVFYEPRHYEQAIANLVIGQQKAALIDTGCGIGNLRKAVEEALAAAIWRRSTRRARRRITFACWIGLTGYFSAATFCFMGQCGRIWKAAVCKTW